MTKKKSTPTPTKKTTPKKEKLFTWADLKKAVVRIPDELLKEPVRIWTDDEQCYVISDVERLIEDYVFDGDEGVAPRSIMKNSDPENWKEYKDEYYTVYPKGCRIINATR